MSDAHELVSIIIPTKDRCALLLETLASVRAQTYPFWEAVVVDDLSADDTWATLRELAADDPRIRPIRRAGHVGGAMIARNQGVTASGGSFILFLDSDDLLAPTALERRLQLARQYPDADAIVLQGEYFREVPGEYTKECACYFRLLDGLDPLDAFLTGNSPWIMSGPLWRRGARERVGPFDSHTPFVQDMQYHTNAIIAGVRFKQFLEVDHYIRHHQGPRTSGNNVTKKISSRIAVCDGVMQQLRARDMLTARRKRMLAWSALLGTLGYALERPKPAFGRTLCFWRAARDRALVGALAYRIGWILALSQWVNLGGPLPRELARLSAFVDLKGKPVLHPAGLGGVWDYLVYAWQHYHNAIRAKWASLSRTPTKPASRLTGDQPPVAREFAEKV